MKRAITVMLMLALAGCQTTMDPNYSLQMESYRLTITSQREVDVAKARAEEARYQAIAEIAVKGDLVSRQTAILALALSGREGAIAPPAPVQLPRIPESQEDRALKWAAIFAGPTIAIAQGYFGYRLGVTQSNNQANTTIASYNALGTTAIAGYGAITEFKQPPLDLSKLPVITTNTTNTTTTVNTNTEVDNHSGQVAVGGGDANRPGIVPPVVVVPPATP